MRRASSRLGLASVAFTLAACSTQVQVMGLDASTNGHPDSSTPDSGKHEADGAHEGSTDAALDSGPVQPATCLLSSTSTIPGVHIEFPSQPCAFTLAQAARGIVFHYDLVVDEDVPDYVSRPTGTGVLEYPGMSVNGLRVATVIGGNGQRYCLCDQGPPPPFCDLPDGGSSYYNPSSMSCDPVTVSRGVSHVAWPSFAFGGGPRPWDGRNWSGPSDTGNPEGASFPPGDYDLTVTIAGRLVGDAGTTDVGAEARFLVRLVR